MTPAETPKIGKAKEKAEEFYKKLLGFLLDNKLPFMIGGTYAFTEYTGIERPTKDIDIVTTESDYPRILKALNEAGYKTKLHEVELNWLAKVQDGDFFIDIMFGERNGLYKVDQSWLTNARIGNILGYTVKLVPVEEMIRSKSYIQNRNRCDSADVALPLLQRLHPKQPYALVEV